MYTSPPRRRKLLVVYLKADFEPPIESPKRKRFAGARRRGPARAACAANVRLA